MVASTDVTTNPDATYSVNVTNENLTDATFTPTLENMIAEYQLSGATSNFPDFVALALKTENWEIEVKISKIHKSFLLLSVLSRKEQAVKTIYEALAVRKSTEKMGSKKAPKAA